MVINKGKKKPNFFFWAQMEIIHRRKEIGIKKDKGNIHPWPNKKKTKVYYLM
jgi:hypothetical protein